MRTDRTDHEGLVDEAMGAFETMTQAFHATTESHWLHLDLTITQLKGVFLLADSGAMIVGRVAEALGIGRPAASILVDGLVGLDLAERAEDPADRRRTIVRPTQRGRELALRLQRGERRAVRALVDRLGDDDLAALTRGLRALAAVVGAHGAPHDAACPHSTHTIDQPDTLLGTHEGRPYTPDA